jgi:hypothetical protein
MTTATQLPKPKHYTGSDLGQDFRSFFTREKNRITKALTALGCKDVIMYRNFYYFSGFFTAPSGQLYYFSISDVRHFSYKQMLYRTAQHYKDFTGGTNQYVDKDKLSELRLK